MGNDQLIEAIIKAASDPNIDIERVRQLTSIREDIQRQESIKAFNQDMSLAQSEIMRVEKNRDNKLTQSSYATYDEIDRMIRPIYTRYGFSVVFETEPAEKESEIQINLILSHKEGHSVSQSLSLAADGLGAKGGVMMSKNHAIGSAITYGKRYLIGMAFNLAFGDDPDDDDGNMSSEFYTETVKNQVAKMEKIESTTKLLEYYRSIKPIFVNSQREWKQLTNEYKRIYLILKEKEPPKETK